MLNCFDQISRAKVVHELVRTLGRMTSTPTVAAYQKTIFDLAERLYPDEVSQITGWRPPAIAGANPDSAPVLMQRSGVLRQWLKNDPQRVFSLLVLLAEGGDESRAWDAIYQ